MRIQETPCGGLKVWLSARDTYCWADRSGSRWPCSQLANHRVFAEFDTRGNLVDTSIDGGRGKQDCDCTEFNACLTDHIASKYPDHPALRGKAQPI